LCFRDFNSSSFAEHECCSDSDDHGEPGNRLRELKVRASVYERSLIQIWSFSETSPPRWGSFPGIAVSHSSDAERMMTFQAALSGGFSISTHFNRK